MQLPPMNKVGAPRPRETWRFALAYPTSDVQSRDAARAHGSAPPARFWLVVFNSAASMWR